MATSKCMVIKIGKAYADGITLISSPNGLCTKLNPVGWKMKILSFQNSLLG